MMQKIIDRCEEEIEWAQANIDEMDMAGNPHNYQEDDRVWLPCWLKAHKEMLEIIGKSTILDYWLRLKGIKQ